MSRFRAGFRACVRSLPSLPDVASNEACLPQKVSEHHFVPKRGYSEALFYMGGLRNGISLDRYPVKFLVAVSGFATGQKETASWDALTACRLSRRGVIRFDGPDTVHFLQGLLTNDVSSFLDSPPPQPHPLPSLTQPAAGYPPIYSALLSPQGRFMYDLFLFSPPAQGMVTSRLDSRGSGPSAGSPDRPALLADVDADFADELVAHLNKHKLRANVSIQDVSADWSVWALFGGELASSSQDAAATGHIGWAASANQAEQQTAEADRAGWSWHRDPRLPALGLRGVFPADELPPLVDASTERPEADFKGFRYSLGVAEGSTEIAKGEALPLEYNLAALNAISFSKGCYVGQELTARTHHRGVVRKRVMPVTVDEPCEDFQVDANVHEPAASKSIGRIVAQSGRRGLALLRLSGALKYAGSLTLGSPGTLLTAHRPPWWPGDWGKEEDVL